LGGGIVEMGGAGWDCASEDVSRETDSRDLFTTKKVCLGGVVPVSFGFGDSMFPGDDGFARIGVWEVKELDLGGFPGLERDS
jgi:hypothetical protein